MRKLIGAALALGCMLSAASAQQLPTENAYTGRFNITLPTFASGQIGPLAVDQNGRLILAPSTSIQISNFPGVQPVSQSGAFVVTQGPAGAAAWKVDGSGVTQPISAANLPLPAGASTAANQTTANTSLASIDTKTPALVNGRQPVDGSGVTQPVSAAGLPLPAGAATSALQSNVQSAPGAAAGTLLGVQGASGGVPLPIQGGNATAVKTDGSATTQPVSAANLPLPAGAATATNQTTAIAALQALNTRAVQYTEQSAQAVAVSTNLSGAVRPAGSPVQWAKFSAVAYSTQAGTVQIRACPDAACATFFIVASAAVPAGGTGTATATIVLPYHQTVLVNGSGGAATAWLYDSYTAN